MALTIATFKDQIHDFLQQVQDKAVAEVADSDVPIAGQVAAAAGEFLFQALEDQIFDAVDQAATIADAAALLDAIDGIDAVYSGDGIDLTITAGGGTLDLVSNTQFNLGGEIGGGVGFQVAGDIGAALDAEMTIGLRITEDDVVVADGAGPELSVGLDVDVSLDKTGGSLGFLTIEVSDRDPDAPEVHVGASIDIQSGSISTLASQDWNPVFAGNAGLDLTVDVIGQEFLPSMTMNLVMGYDLTGVTSPTIAFNDISIDVASMFGVFAEVLVEMADILDTEPLGTLLDIMTGPVPLIDDLAHGVPGLAPGVLDPIPSLLPDGIVSLVDLAAVKDSIQGNEANKFYDVLGMLGFVRSIGQQIGSAGSINLGDLDFSQGLAAGGADAFLDAFQATTGIDFVQTFNDIIGSNPVFEQISDELRDSFTSNSGLEIPILDDPTLIVQFLFNEIFGDVDIVRFDLPDLDFEAEAELFFSILGPLGLVLGGEVNGHLDMTVGYDTAGLSAALQGGDLAENLLKGIYFTTKQNTDPIDPDSNPTGFDAVAHVDGRISAGAALRAVVVNASITGGIGFGTPERGIDGWFNVESDGKLRLADLDGCFIDVSGTAVADVQVEIEIGFDPFSFTERIPLVSTVLADFDIVDCLTDVTSPDGQGLATFAPAGFGVHDLVLNTGDRASQRVFEGGGTTSVGTDVAENYEIRFARDVVSGGPTPGTTVYGPPMLDTLDLTAFGITQRYGVDTTDSIDDADQRIFAIRANLGEGNDSVVLEKEIGIFAFIDGGAGNDLIVGGAGNDELDGGEGDDFLIGNGGDDTLTGGNGNDQLEGGAGADMLDGGAGRDKVSYYDAATEAVQILADAGGQLVGVAGDAVGDTFVSIEYFVGTRFNDTLTSAQDASDQDTATLEGREGDDLLLGSDNKKDFLIGGAGADTMVGGDLEDGTTYLSSYGAVTIDLQNHIYYGGDANGDVLDSIEDVQGSAFDDFIVGDSGNNVIDGFIGDDVLTGFLGQDRVLGGAGNDTVYAYADGDLLDGGGLLNDPGRDLLTYELANTPGVTVNLATKVGGGGDVVAAAQRITGEDPTTHAPVFAEAVGYSTFENLTGSQGSDNLTGDNQANVIRGLAGNDTISGGGGNDILIGGAGADHFSGGAGFDWVDYSEATGAVDVSLFEGDVSHGAEAEGDTFTNPGGFGDFADVLENLRGSRFSDDLSGDNRDNIIDPGLSDSGATGDFVNGQGGNDTLWLDYSVGVQGKGLVGGYDSGKADQGTFSRQAATTTDVIDSVRFFGIENLYVIGTASNDKVYGASGNDVVITGDGDDTILGGTGMDALFAGSGNDTVEYGTGLNRQTLATHNPTFFQLDGGDGIDTLNLHLGGMTTGVTIVGPADGAEWNGHNLLFANGASAHNFEILADIDTGSGNDYLEQQGRANNNWFTSVGIDTIKPGLGSDFVNAGVETDGLSFGTNDEGRYIAQVVDAAAYYGSPGDLLVLDYSSLAAGQHVESDSSLVDTDITIGRHHFINEIEEVWDYWSVQGNSGYYRTLNTDGSPVGDSIISIFHDRVDITGSDGDDVLLGSWVPYDSFLGASAKGDDVLHGGKGNDALYGQTGDDFLYGDDGNDVLVGSVRQQADSLDVSYDNREIDHLFGGSGADTFVVGEWNANFYADTSPNFSNHYAVIEDFNPFAGDKVQFTGALSNYTEVIVNGVDKEILLNGDLIAYIKGGIFFDMARDGVSAPFLPIFLPFAATQTSSLAAVAPEEPSAEPAGASPIMALASAGAFTVEAESDPALLLQKLGQPAGFSNTSLTIDGNAQAVGWFADDPFGLGGGIVISTGRVEDLPGANTDAGASPATLRELPLDFVKIGTVNNSTVYKATLTGLDIDMQSITLNDSNLRTEGGDGQVSGFDLNSIMLSTVDIPVGGSLAGINTMSRLNVFDFSAAGTHYRAGDQRFDPLDSFNDAAPYLRGSLTDSLINNARATLQTLDVYDSFQNGFVSLGDGGSIGFDLTTPVSTNGPLYLYVSEADASTGETLTGVISASTEQVEPAGDLSTDLGDRGLGGDTTTLTYHFTPDAKSATVQFQVVLFSEELPEFAGAAPFDVLSATLNGVSIGTLSDGKAATLDNLMVTTYGPKHPDLILNTPVTGPAADLIRADAYTTVLTFTGRADVGVDNVLKLEVADKGDAFLDTGIMIRALTLTGAPIPGAITVTASGEVVENGADATITVTRPDDADTDSTVTVHLTPSGNLELGEGGGAGEGVDVVFEPGESGSKDVSVKAVSNDGPSLPAHVDATVTSDDPDFTNPAIPRIGFDIVDTYMVPENTLDVTDLSVPGIPDGTSLAWSVTGGADAAQFEIDPATAKLSFVTAPDFENPSDTGADNAYDLVVTARNGAGAVVDEQTLNVVVTDVSETSVLRVTFESESSNYKNTLGWYDSRTGEGGILFASVDSHGRCHLNPGDTVAFEVDSTAVPFIGFFLIPNGGGLRQNSESELSGAIKVIQLSNGSWAVATVDDCGAVETDRWGRPNILVGTGANALFSETAKNAGNIDYASSVPGRAQTPATLAGDTVDGPTGRMAWEDTAASRSCYGTYGRPGDADYNDAVFTVAEFKSRTLTGTNGPETLNGGIASDFLYGKGGDDVLNGNDGNDKLDGGQGADRMNGGRGDDLYIVDNPGDDVNEALRAGDDTVRSSISYILPANVENLILVGVDAINGTGNSLANALTGNAAANILDGKGGADRMAGGEGDDTYIVDHCDDRVIEEINQGTDTVLSSVSYRLAANVENLTLAGSASINATGNSDANLLIGNSGNNVLDGKAGADRMEGKDGNDTYLVDDAGDVVVEESGGGTDTVRNSVSFVLPDNVENLTLTGNAAIDATGNAADNILIGNDADNILDGAGGADRMEGKRGNDTYVVDNPGDKVIESHHGGTDLVLSSISFALGNDVENLTLTGNAAINGTGNNLANTLIGNGAANVLKGSGGSDIIVGNGGADSLYGGNDGSRDTFVFNAITDSGITASTWDRVFDFHRGIDKIDLSAIDAGAAAGDQMFRFVHDFDAGSTGQVRIVDAGPDVLVEIDLQGDNTVDMIIEVERVATLGSSDFIL